MKLHDKVKPLKDSYANEVEVKNIVSTDVITLSRHPVTNTEVSTKQYVDNKFSEIDFSVFDKGTLSTTVTPEYTGDVTKPSSGDYFTLADRSIIESNYTKLTVNEKGLVINTPAKALADIPAFNWSKIISDKPNTLAGYGIIDCVKYSGTTVIGNITMNGSVTAFLHAATKEYLESKTPNSGVSGTEVGKLVVRPTPNTPGNTLRANGGQVSRSTYSALFNVIGTSFTKPSTPVTHYNLPDMTAFENNSTYYFIVY